MRYDEILRSKDIDDAAKQYMESIRYYKPLNGEEEHKLIIDYKKHNDINARNKLINSNLKYTCKLANSFRNRGVPFSHLISEANSALLYALEKYDEKRKTKLMTYARWWIIQRVNDLVTNRQFEYNDLPTDKMEQFDENTDFAIESDMPDTYANSAFYSQSETSKTNDNNDLLKELYAVLNEREIDILNRYYGRNPYEKNQTLEEIGKEYKISKERVRQLIQRSLTKLRTEALITESKFC